MLGNLLEDSGWASALTQGDIASSGTADTFIKAIHVTKTQHAHEITAASLYILLPRAYDVFFTSASPNQDEVALSFQEWCSKRAKKCVQFDYWTKTVSLEILLLVFVRSIREGNFDMYVESLTQIVSCFFALDHTHYSRWLSVHIRDMMMLSEKHPSVFAEIKAENFLINKTGHKFSALAMDQCQDCGRTRSCSHDRGV